MNEKELREIKRRFRPERSNISKIVGCFVNENGQIIYRIDQSIALSDTAVSEKLLAAMKKTLSGGLGTNLNSIAFSTKQVLEGEEHKLLTALNKSHLGDKDALEQFYTRVTETVKFDSNYVILLANDIYDVPSYSKDGERGESSEVFSYVICSVCPIKSLPDAITFKESDSLFHSLSVTSLLGPCELGFMFPGFEDRRTNIYSALYYTRSVADNYPAFAEKIFGSLPGMPPKAQKNAFNGALSEALSEECSFEVVRSVHAQMAEMAEAHKQSGEKEPLVITKSTVKAVLENCGVGEEKVEKLGEMLDESFGSNAEITPKNIISTNKFEIETPEVKIKVDPEHRDIITTQTINNVKYVMIRVSGSIEVNGINISIDD